MFDSVHVMTGVILGEIDLSFCEFEGMSGECDGCTDGMCDRSELASLGLENGFRIINTTP